MTDFFRFPHTPHMAWLGPGTPRDDKVLTSHEMDALLASDIVVEEKVDGANLGFSLDARGIAFAGSASPPWRILCAQNRGTYLDLEALHGQWKPLKRWLTTRRHALADALGTDLMLFGEWCYAVHSVRYTCLPDWFLAFDVYDRKKTEFWSADRRNDFAKQLDIMTVPELGRGRYTLESLKRLLDTSRVTDGPAEGLYLRREAGGVLTTRAKLVRAEFVQSINEHWSKRTLEENRLSESATARR